MIPDSGEYNILEITDRYSSKNNPSSSTWVYDQVVGLIKSGYKPLTLSPTPFIPFKGLFKKKFWVYDTPSIFIEEYNGTKVLRPGYIKVPYNKLIHFSLNNLSNCLLKHGNYKEIKIIHSHFGQNGVAALKLKNKLKVPLITSFYGFDLGSSGKFYRPYYIDLIKQGDLFLALSQDMKSDLIKYGFPEEKILIHHLGIDLNYFKCSTRKQEKFILLSVARLFEKKGIQFIILALSKFFEKYPQEKKNIIYKIIGGGPYERELKILIEKNKLADNIIFINNLIMPNSREIVKEEMMSCNLFLLCSIHTEDGGKEGTPVVLMEAQACGKPCIASFHAGIPEVVINNETGILTKERNVEEIAVAIETLYFQHSLREYFGLNARNHISKEFNHSIQIQKLVGIIEELINGRCHS
jgi:glycosyltransferase involved in cell wall biosynthesis